MTGIKKVFWETIKILDKNKILDYVVLVGSWAEYIYEISGYLGTKAGIPGFLNPG